LAVAIHPDPIGLLLELDEAFLATSGGEDMSPLRGQSQR
jgi:hypothetical protein